MSEFRRRLESETDPWVKSVGKVLQDILEEEAYKQHVLRRLKSLERRRINDRDKEKVDPNHKEVQPDNNNSTHESSTPGT